MKYIIILLFICGINLFSQQWEKDKWEMFELYENNQPMELTNIRVYDVKCFGNENCIAVGLSNNFFLMVFNYDRLKSQWNLSYDGRWDIYSPQEEWPDIIIDNQRGVNIINDSTVFIYFQNTPLINVFNFITQEDDTVHYNPAYPFGNAVLNNDGYGMASVGTNVYTTTNSWENNNYKDIEFPSSAFDVPIRILNDNRFSIADYDHGKCYFIVSTDGLEWERFPVGDFYPYNIDFIDDKIGFIVGIDLLTNSETGYDVVYKTTDGGQNWYQVLHQYNQLDLDANKPTSWGLYDIKFFNDSIGIASSKPGMIYTTTNQGESWEYSFLDEMAQSLEYMEVSIGDNKIYLLSRGNGIYSYDVGLLGITSVPFYKYKELESYPNPFINEIIIAGDKLKAGQYHVNVYSVDSKLVYSTEKFIENDTRIDLDIPNGSYYLLLESDNDYYYKKIVKE